MNTKIGFALCALFGSLAIAGAGDTSPAPATGKILVLDNERVLEGTVERQGDQYRVRRKVGEVWIQKENVLKLCQTREEAYQFLRTQANLADPDERLRLANWCHREGLKQQALAEVAAAVELRPNHAASRRLLNNLERAATQPATVKVAKRQDEQESPPTTPIVNSDSLSPFVTKVQPLLMNACAGCHASGKGGNFKLIRTFESGLSGRRATLYNLGSVLAQVNPSAMHSSNLLTRALSIHGDMTQPAIKNREAPAYRVLEDWLRITLESNPQLTENLAVGPAPSSSKSPEASTGAVKQTSNFADATAEKLPSPAKTMKPAAEAVKEPGKPAANSDPFDPAIFNQQMHPAQKSEAK